MSFNRSGASSNGTLMENEFDLSGNSLSNISNESPIRDSPQMDITTFSEVSGFNQTAQNDTIHSFTMHSLPDLSIANASMNSNKTVKDSRIAVLNASKLPPPGKVPVSVLKSKSEAPQPVNKRKSVTINPEVYYAAGDGSDKEKYYTPQASHSPSPSSMTTSIHPNAHSSVSPNMLDMDSTPRPRRNDRPRSSQITVTDQCNQIDQLQKQNFNLKLRCTILEKHLYGEETEDTSGMNEQIDDELRTKLREIDEKDSVITEKDTRILKLEKAISDLEEKLVDKNDEIEHLQHELKENEYVPSEVSDSKFQSLKQEKDLLEKKVKEYARQLDEYSRKVTFIENEKREVQFKLQDKNDEVEAIRKQFSEHIEKSDSLNHDLHKQLQVTSKELDEVQTQFMDSRTKAYEDEQLAQNLLSNWKNVQNSEDLLKSVAIVVTHLRRKFSDSVDACDLDNVFGSDAILRYAEVLCEQKNEIMEEKIEQEVERRVSSLRKSEDVLNQSMQTQTTQIYHPDRSMQTSPMQSPVPVTNRSISASPRKTIADRLSTQPLRPHSAQEQNVTAPVCSEQQHSKIYSEVLNISDAICRLNSEFARREQFNSSQASNALLKEFQQTFQNNLMKKIENFMNQLLESKSAGMGSCDNDTTIAELTSKVRLQDSMLDEAREQAVLQVSRLERVLEAKENQIEVLKNDLKFAAETHAEQEHKISALNKEIKVLGEEIGAYEERMLEFNEDKKKLRDTYMKKLQEVRASVIPRETINHIMKGFSDVTKQCQATFKLIEELAEAADKSSTTLFNETGMTDTQSNATFNTSGVKLKDLTEQLNDSLRSVQNSIQNIHKPETKEIEKLEKENEEIRTQLQNQDAKIRRLEDELENVLSKNDSEMSNVSDVAAKILELETGNEKLNDEIVALRSKNEEAEKKMQLAEEEKLNLMGEIHSVKRRMNGISLDNHNLQKLQSDNSMTIKSQNEIVRNLKAKIQELQTELNKSEERRRRQKEKISCFKTKVSKEVTHATGYIQDVNARVNEVVQPEAWQELRDNNIPKQEDTERN